MLILSICLNIILFLALFWSIWYFDPRKNVTKNKLEELTHLLKEKGLIEHSEYLNLFNNPAKKINFKENISQEDIKINSEISLLNILKSDSTKIRPSIFNNLREKKINLSNFLHYINKYIKYLLIALASLFLLSILYFLYKKYDISYNLNYKTFLSSGFLILLSSFLLMFVSGIYGYIKKNWYIFWGGFTFAYLSLFLWYIKYWNKENIFESFILFLLATFFYFYLVYLRYSESKEESISETEYLFVGILGIVSICGFNLILLPVFINYFIVTSLFVILYFIFLFIYFKRINKNDSLSDISKTAAALGTFVVFYSLFSSFYLSISIFILALTYSYFNLVFKNKNILIPVIMFIFAGLVLVLSSASFEKLSPFLNIRFLAYMTAFVSLLLSAGCFHKLEKAIHDKALSFWSTFGVVLANITLIVGFLIESRNLNISTINYSILISVFFILYSSILLFLGFNRNSFLLKIMSLFILSITIVKIFFMDIFKYSSNSFLISFIFSLFLVGAITYLLIYKKNEVVSFFKGYL